MADKNTWGQNKPNSFDRQRPANGLPDYFSKRSSWKERGIKNWLLQGLSRTGLSHAMPYPPIHSFACVKPSLSHESRTQVRDRAEQKSTWDMTAVVSPKNRKKRKNKRTALLSLCSLCTSIGSTSHTCERDLCLFLCESVFLALYFPFHYIITILVSQLMYRLWLEHRGGWCPYVLLCICCLYFTLVWLPSSSLDNDQLKMKWMHFQCISCQKFTRYSLLACCWSIGADMMLMMKFMRRKEKESYYVCIIRHLDSQRKLNRLQLYSILSSSSII